MSYVHGYHARERQRLQDQAGALVELLHARHHVPGGQPRARGRLRRRRADRDARGRSPGARFISIDVSADSLAAARGSTAGLTTSSSSRRTSSTCRSPRAPSTTSSSASCSSTSPAGRGAARARASAEAGRHDHRHRGRSRSAYFHPDSAAAHDGDPVPGDAAARAGGNALIGRRLYPLLSEAGLRGGARLAADGVRGREPPHLVDGFTRKTFMAMIEGVREPAIAAGLIDADRFDEGIRDLTGRPRAAGLLLHVLQGRRAQSSLSSI